MRTFANWVSVPENRAARAAVERVADGVCAGRPRQSVNPLFLHGPDSGPPDVQIVWRTDLLDEVEFGGRRVRISLSPPARQLRTSSITVPNISSVTNSLPGLADAISLGWGGFVQVLLFMALLLAGYIYVWRKGALDWSADKSVAKGIAQRAKG